MQRFFICVLMVTTASCATDFERRAVALADADAVTRETGLKDPNYPQFLYETALLRTQQVNMLFVNRADDEARRLLARQVEDLTFLLENYPSFPRRGEAMFYRADALSLLHRWPEARRAWRELPADIAELHRRSTMYRRQQAEAECRDVDAGC